MDIKPEDAITLKMRGIVHHNTGQYDNALRDLNKALDIKPEDAIASSGLIIKVQSFIEIT